MSDTPTPRIDAFLKIDHVAYDAMWIEFAHQLERELAAANAALAEANAKLGETVTSPCEFSAEDYHSMRQTEAALREANRGLSNELGGSQLEANALREQVRVLKEIAHTTLVKLVQIGNDFIPADPTQNELAISELRNAVVTLARHQTDELASLKTPEIIASELAELRAAAQLSLGVLVGHWTDEDDGPGGCAVRALKRALKRFEVGATEIKK